jgi:NADPH2:quinone reductase
VVPKQPLLSTMRALVADRFGGPEVLELRDIAAPSLSEGQLRVQVHASGANPVDITNLMDGVWPGISPPFVLGYEASGVVYEVGPGVTGFAIGDEVMVQLDVRGTVLGTNAEYVVTNASTAVAKPDLLRHTEAAGLPLAGGTAYAILERLDVQPGEWLLIHGAAGGVGTFLVQLAVDRGARVVGVASRARHALLHELGVEICIDYQSGDSIAATRASLGDHVDAVADLVGGELLSRSLALLRRHGRGCSIVAFRGDFDLAIDNNLTLHGVLFQPNREVLAALSSLVGAGRLRPIVDAVLPIEEARRGYERLASGHGQGKVILQVR